MYKGQYLRKNVAESMAAAVPDPGRQCLIFMISQWRERFYAYKAQ
jgi:hypothetical protein